MLLHKAVARRANIEYLCPIIWGEGGVGGALGRRVPPFNRLRAVVVVLGEDIEQANRTPMYEHGLRRLTRIEE